MAFTDFFILYSTLRSTSRAWTDTEKSTLRSQRSTSCKFMAWKRCRMFSLHEVFTLLPKVNSVGCSATVCTEYRNTSLYGAFSCEVDGHIWISHICVEILRFCKQPCFAVTQCTTFIKCVVLDSYLLIPDCASALNCNEALSGFGLVHNLNPRLCVVATVCAFLTHRCGS